MRRKIKKVFLTVLLIGFFSGFALSAPGVVIKAVKVEKAPNIDGRLDEEIWKKIDPFTDFKQVEPVSGGPPSEKTELRVAYDQANLYIGIYCYDHEPNKISANNMAHDAERERRASDDLIRVLIDSLQDKRNAYVFFVNPKGARSEGLASGENFSLNWDGIWEARSAILHDGWSCEIRIPFKTLSFKPGLSSWGFNVERDIPRKMEVIRLSGHELNNFFYNPKEAAELIGLSGLKQGLGLTFRPYGLVTEKKDYVSSSDGREYSANGGFDLYKSFTPNFVGAFSYKTDFAETEVDDRRINLTRFPLYFPEKRTFFLEGSEIFNFGSGLGQTFIPFFSRRIGLYEGEQIPLSYGLKFFGRLGRTNLSVLDVRTAEFGQYPAENFLAARVYQNIFSESKVGLIFTSGSPTGEKNSLFGLDFTYSTSRFRGNKNLLLGAWWVYNWNTLSGGRHQGYGLRFDYPNDLWDCSATYNFFGDALNPGIGFLPRNAIHYLYWGIAYQPRPEKGLIGRLVRQFFFELRGNFYWDLSGNLETSRIFTAPINLRTESGEHIEFNVIANRDVLPGDFEIAEGVVLPPGGYNFINYRFELNTAAYRPVGFDLSYRFGQFYSGNYHDVEIGLTARLKGYLNLNITSEIVRGYLPQGNFKEDVLRLKADLFLTPDLGLMNYVQYDDISHSIGWNLRFRWQIKPGNEIYFVYNKNWGKVWDPSERFLAQSERAVFKIQLSLRQ